jgi:hypothetical protein
MLLAATAVTAATAATADRLMEASPKVAMAATDLCSVLVMTSTLLTYGIAGRRQAVTVAWRSEDVAAGEEMAALAAMAATWRKNHSRAAAMVEMWSLKKLYLPPPFKNKRMTKIQERAAMVATERAAMVATAATAATAGRLMAATRLAAMAATELRSVRAIRSPACVSLITAQ